MHMLKEYILPGEKLTSEAEFYRVLGEVINGPGGYFGSNLDALRDCLAGACGPSEPYTLRWQISDRSRELLGYETTIKVLRSRLKTCHRSNRASIREATKRAESGEGPTFFDEVLSVIEEADNVTLILE